MKRAGFSPPPTTENRCRYRFSIARTSKRDGSAPCWLYGYGSYGIAIPAAFNANWLSLANRGFVCAIAHVRGGKDRGHRWYRDGKRENKTNTFKDFVAAAQHLCSERFTSPGRIIAHGGSAGGMLMGVAANLAPDLFNGIIAEVPFVDVLNTMLDDTLPLTPPEWQEWGNPIESKAVYELIAAYSPYENVARRAYPHILAIGGLTDPRVTYWEPAKWVARLREHKTNDTLLLLKTHMEAGHAGAPGRFDRLKEVAFVYAFGFKIAGWQPTANGRPSAVEPDRATAPRLHVVPLPAGTHRSPAVMRNLECRRLCRRRALSRANNRIFSPGRGSSWAPRRRSPNLKAMSPPRSRGSRYSSFAAATACCAGFAMSAATAEHDCSKRERQMLGHSTARITTKDKWVY